MLFEPTKSNDEFLIEAQRLENIHSMQRLQREERHDRFEAVGSGQDHQIICSDETRELVYDICGRSKRYYQQNSQKELSHAF